MRTKCVVAAENKSYCKLIPKRKFKSNQFIRNVSFPLLKECVSEGKRRRGEGRRREEGGNFQIYLTNVVAPFERPFLFIRSRVLSFANTRKTLRWRTLNRRRQTKSDKKLGKRASCRRIRAN